MDCETVCVLKAFCFSVMCFKVVDVINAKTVELCVPVIIIEKSFDKAGW